MTNKANEVWSWDITYLASTIKGQFYYLYLFEDIYSRKIVGYEVYEQECGERAGNLLQRCMLREQCLNTPLVLHSGFVGLEAARDWVQNFVEWYNNKHRHSKINFVTPAQRHRGEDRVILENRKLVLEKKREADPLRWSRGVRNCQPAGPVSLNQEN